MNVAGTSVSLLGAIAMIAALLSVATVWLLLTDPVGVADAVSQGAVTPLVRELASAIAEAFAGLLKYL